MSDSISDCEIYSPKNDSDVKLDVELEAYSYLEYISLEYPSQTVINRRNRLIVAQCGHENSIVKLTFKNLDKNAKFKYRKTIIENSVNRLRHNSSMIVGTCDNSAYIFDGKFNIKKEILGCFSYGLSLSEDRLFLGCQTGDVMMVDAVSHKKETLRIHTDGIDGLCFKNNLLCSASNDNTLKITDIRTNENVYVYESRANINSVDTSVNNMIFGDDTGDIFIVDMRNRSNLEKITWHKSPINAVMFKDSDVFCTVSNEQVCLWDLSLEDEWEYHQYLYFVHQGQRYYKECTFISDYFVTTSQDGLTIFKPTEGTSETTA